MDVIIFMQDGEIRMMHPFLGSGLATLQIGQKDVPEGIPFWVIDSTEMPAETQWSYLEIDPETAGEPAGYGGTYLAPEEEENDVQDQ
ncbi:hypothetical protein V4841_08505 [Lelliottia amnigena]|uniref:Phage tail protein n=1 Tax=Lelliottia amnigena TaxID=61646 RepID=A0ABU7UAQ4_LELAM